MRAAGLTELQYGDNVLLKKELHGFHTDMYDTACDIKNKTGIFFYVTTIVIAFLLVLHGTLCADMRVMYRGNKNSLIYHNSTCKYFNCKNCTVIFNSAHEAKNAGYRACKICKG